MVMRPSHPITRRRDRWIAEHRVVLFEKLGPGEQACHWCSKPLTWDDVKADHLNGVKTDNRPKNLVASCNPCNYVRGSIMPFIGRLTEAGFSSIVDVFADYRRQIRTADADSDSDCSDVRTA